MEESQFFLGCLVFRVVLPFRVSKQKSAVPWFPVLKETDCIFVIIGPHGKVKTIP